MKNPAPDPMDEAPVPTSRLQRWRLVLGEPAESSCGNLGTGRLCDMGRALDALYEAGSKMGASGGGRRGGRENSAPNVTRWLGDIRKYFPAPVVQVMQQDAMERLNLRELLLQPEMLASVQPDVHLVATLVSLASVIPEETKDSARQVVRQVAQALMQRLREPLRSSISGALERSVRNHRPRHGEIDWPRTIRANLRHWQQAHGSIIPERLIGYGRKAQRPQREIVLCIDQSGSMSESIVYSSIFAAVMASLPAVRCRMVLFDTAVVDMTEQLSDPVDVLFGVQLGGGTDIHRAVSYCQALIREPRNTILVLISDLYEGGVENKLLRRATELVDSGVQFITLLALSDEGRPAYDAQLAAKLSALGVPSFACTPDAFPDLMAAAIRRESVQAWAGARGMVASPPQ